MNDNLYSLLVERRNTDNAIAVKIDAGTMSVEELGYNPKLLRDEINLINQLLYLQEVRAEITSNNARNKMVENKNV